MPFGSITLQPGVNVQRTPMQLRAGFAQSFLIRFRDQLVQKFGGWLRFYPFAIGGVPRDLHAWQDLNGNSYLSVATTTQVGIITGGAFSDISPQILVSDFAPNISTTNGSSTITVVDPNIANVTTNDSVFFNTPVAIGGLVLAGLYQIGTILGTTSYSFTFVENGSPVLATATNTNPNPTNATTAAGNNTLHFAATPAWVVAGMVVADLTTPASIPASTIVNSVTGTTVVMSNNAAGAGVGNGDNIVFASIPVFATTSGTSIVTVTLINHGMIVNSAVNFRIPTTGNNVTISGSYNVLTVPSANTFTIAVNTQANATGNIVMNGGKAEIVYQISLGPPPVGSGYGLGGYGSGGYGTGSIPASQTGTDLAASSWTTGNWGQILLGCPFNGGIYYWQPAAGFQTMTIIASAPPFNAGMFISNTQQIVVAYGSSVAIDIGLQQQSLLVQWSDVGNFFQWKASSSTQAGNFTLSSGSKLVGGLAVPTQNLLWTDIDLWAMNYVGPPNVFGFSKIGAGAGLVSAHAIQTLRGAVFWMGPSNFYVYSGGGVSVLPCPVWDAVFQNLNTAFLMNICAMPNTPFNEFGWFYPSLASVSGENDSFVMMNMTEPGAPWTVGPISALQRSAWIDQSILGNPIGANSAGQIFQHETTADADGQPMTSSFTTGDFYLDEGEQFVSVDQIMPDMRWETYTGTTSAQIQLTFNVTNFPGDTPISYGPFTVNQQTEYLNVRFRGRLMSITVASADLGSFWRLGTIKFRYTYSGRR